MFCDGFKKLRKDKKITQAEAGEILGMSQQTIASWEAGRSMPTIDMLAKICSVFDVSSDSLLGIGPAPEPTVPHPEAFQMMRAQGARIASAREAAGMSVKEVAAAIGITEEEYVRLEAGTQTEYDMGTLPGLSKLFGITQTYILFGVDSPPPQPPMKRETYKSKLLLKSRSGLTLEKELTDAQFDALKDAISKISSEGETKQ